MIKIVGAKGQIKNVDLLIEQVISFAQEKNIAIQALNADMIYGKNHLVSAIDHAKRAMNLSLIHI